MFKKLKTKKSGVVVQKSQCLRVFLWLKLFILISSFLKSNIKNPFVVYMLVGADFSGQLLVDSPREPFPPSSWDTTGIFTDEALSISFYSSSSDLKALNCPSSDLAAANHAVTMTNSIIPRYGVELASDPKDKIMNCCIRAPPDFPNGLQTTSIAAFPLTCKQSHNPQAKGHT